MKSLATLLLIAVTLQQLLLPKTVVAQGDSPFTSRTKQMQEASTLTPAKQAVISNPINLSSNEGVSNSVLAARDHSGHLHVIWNDNTAYPYKGDVIYRRQVGDTLNEWSTPLVITESTTSNIAIDADGSVNIFTCGNSGELFYTKFNPQHDVIFARFKLSAGCSYKGQEVTIDSNHRIYMVHIALRWVIVISDATVVEITVPLDNPRSVIVQANGTIHVAGENSSGDILYTYKPSDAPWSEPVNVSNNPTKSELPVLAFDLRNQLHVYWVDQSGPITRDYFHRVFGNGIWSEVTVLPELQKMLFGLFKIYFDSKGNFYGFTQQLSGVFVSVDKTDSQFFTCWTIYVQCRFSLSYDGYAHFVGWARYIANSPDAYPFHLAGYNGKIGFPTRPNICATDGVIVSGDNGDAYLFTSTGPINTATDIYLWKIQLVDQYLQFAPAIKNEIYSQGGGSQPPSGIVCKFAG